MKQFLREITPLAKDKLFFAKNTPDDPMNFPLHYHDDFELTLTLNVKAQRIVGNTIEDIGERDLVLIGPNEPHCYKRNPEYDGVRCDVSVIQFPKRLMGFNIFSTDILRPISDMFFRAAKGIRFSDETARSLQTQIQELPQKTGIESVLAFMDILYRLATSEDQVVLSAVAPGNQSTVLQSPNNRINRIFKYVELNYMNKITLDQVGEQIQMSPSAVSRFFKSKTLYKFNDFLNDYRVDKVAQRMQCTDDSIAEISYACGFNNISNFNRSFKRRMGMTPSEYRQKLKNGEVPNEGVLLKRWDVINGKIV